jgi:hypothetical protein
MFASPKKFKEYLFEEPPHYQLPARQIINLFGAPKCLGPDLHVAWCFSLTNLKGFHYSVENYALL